MKSLLLLLFVYTFGTSLTNGYPAEDNKSKFLGSFISTSNSLSAANGYQVAVSQKDVNGECKSTLVITGHGIDKAVEYPCKNEIPAVINLNKSLLVGDYFTDTPGELIHIVNGTCERETFMKTDDGKTTSSLMTLDDKLCEKVIVKVEVLKEEQVKWEEWYKLQQELAQQQFMLIQQNLMSLQNNLFHNFFTGFNGFWGKK